jgi:hypothetical protein
MLTDGPDQNNRLATELLSYSKTLHQLAGNVSFFA